MRTEDVDGLSVILTNENFLSSPEVNSEHQHKIKYKQKHADGA